MKTSSTRRNYHCQGLTLLEVTVIIAILGILAALLLPALAKSCRPARRSKCVNNLKNICLAFHIFAVDNNDQYPMQLAITNGGSREILGDPWKVWFTFSVLSNELSTPKIVLCPEDHYGRLEATRFPVNRNALAGMPADIPFSSNQNLSFFLGVDATGKENQMLLAGDRSLTNGFPSPFRFGEARVGSLGTNHLPNRGAGWDKRVHREGGNVCLNDGSVRQSGDNYLRMLLRDSGNAENRIANPD